MIVNLLNVSNPVSMDVHEDYTDIIIRCDKGQNIAIERFLSEIDINHQNLQYEVSIKQKKASRSKNANSYMWVVADRIAKSMLITKEEVYRTAIKQVGVFQDVAVQSGEPCAELIKTWSSNGIGWFAEMFDTSLTDKYGDKMKRIRLYKGSSRYNTEEMSRLIDWIVEEAKALGIETATPDELEELKRIWGEEHVEG